MPLVVFNHIIYRGRRVADIPRELLKLLSTAEHATPERLVTVNVKLAEQIAAPGITSDRVCPLPGNEREQARRRQTSFSQLSGTR